MDKLRRLNNNVFAFAKAFPLAVFENNEVKSLGSPLTRHSSNFNIEVKKKFQKQNKVVNC